MNRILPILFNTEMVKAILEGRKTVTRRLVKATQLIGLGCDDCPNNLPEEYIKHKKMLFKPWCDMTDNELIGAIYKSPFEPGDILYVRETWYRGLNRILYKANYSETEKFYENGKEIQVKWKPSLHMPKEAARIWLKVKGVKAERLQDMRSEDALNEGIKVSEFDLPNTGVVTRFKYLWNSTIKRLDRNRYGWNANPWVWVIEFERCEKPEDN